jgi:hypothetical protein
MKNSETPRQTRDIQPQITGSDLLPNPKPHEANAPITGSPAPKPPSKATSVKIGGIPVPIRSGTSGD